MSIVVPPIAFQIPHTNFEAVLLGVYAGRPLGIVLDPRSTCPPVKWNFEWDAARRGMRGSGLSLTVRKAVAILAKISVVGHTFLTNLRSASMSFEISLLTEEGTTTVEVRRSSSIPKSKKKSHPPRSPRPLLTARSLRSGKNRTVDKVYSPAGTKIRCQLLDRAVDMLLSARPISTTELSGLTKTAARQPT